MNSLIKYLIKCWKFKLVEWDLKKNYSKMTDREYQNKLNRLHCLKASIYYSRRLQHRLSRHSSLVGV